MNNINQCQHGLEYHSFSIIQLQTFCAGELKKESEDDSFIKKFEELVNSHIFMNKLSF